MGCYFQGSGDRVATTCRATIKTALAKSTNDDLMEAIKAKICPENNAPYRSPWHGAFRSLVKHVGRYSLQNFFGVTTLVLPSRWFNSYWSGSVVTAYLTSAYPMF
jgi:hypothetical protein